MPRRRFKYSCNSLQHGYSVHYVLKLLYILAHNRNQDGAKYTHIHAYKPRGLIQNLHGWTIFSLSISMYISVYRSVYIWVSLCHQSRTNREEVRDWSYCAGRSASFTRGFTSKCPLFFSFFFFAPARAS